MIRKMAQKEKNDQWVYEDLSVYIHLVNFFQKDGAFCCLHTYSFSIVGVNNYYHFLNSSSEFHISVLLVSIIFFLSPGSYIDSWDRKPLLFSPRGNSLERSK